MASYNEDNIQYSDKTVTHTGVNEWIEIIWDGTGYWVNDEYYEDLLDLDFATTYEFQTQAKNEAGEGDWSASDTFTTLDIEVSRRDIEITGELEANNERDISLFGKIDENSEKDIEINTEGKAIGENDFEMLTENSEESHRTIEINGIDDEISQKNIEIIGEISSNSEKEFNLVCKEVKSNERNFELSGKKEENTEKEFEILVKESEFSEREIELHVTDDEENEKEFEINGTLYKWSIQRKVEGGEWSTIEENVYIDEILGKFIYYDTNVLNMITYCYRIKNETGLVISSGSLSQEGFNIKLIWEI